MEKLYVLVRTDLKGSSSAVQAGHAVAQWVIEHPNSWMNETLIYLNAGTAENLEAWRRKVHYKDMAYT